MKKTVLGIWFLIGSLAAAHIQAQSLEKAPPPAWIEARSWENTAKSPRSSTGYIDLLIDCQVNAESQEMFLHFVYRLTSSDVLEDGGNVILDFQPSFQKIRLHELKRWRGEDFSDQLYLDFDLIQREKSLDSAMYEGTKSWISFLKDLRIGDTVELAYTVEGFNPIFDGKFCGSFEIQGNSPVGEYFLRIVSAPERRLSYKNFGLAEAGSLSQTNYGREYRLEMKDIPPYKSEGNLPMDALIGGKLEVSEFTGWSEVAAWAGAMFERKEKSTYPDDLESILNEKTDKDDKLNEILTFVQDKVRYLGIETGVNSHLPRQPAEVLANRYGDCKDKALLFCALAEAAGEKAWPVLVSTWRGTQIGDDLPSPLSFNHVIVAFRRGEAILWLDPTSALQGGRLMTRSIARFVWGLEIKEGTDRLSPIPKPRLYEIFRNETYNIRAIGGSADIQVEQVFTEGAADRVRSDLADDDEEKLMEYYKNILTKEFGEIQLKKAPQVKDNRIANILTVNLFFEAKNLWKTSDKRKSLTIYPFLVGDFVSINPNSEPRTGAWRLADPIFVQETKNIVMPEDWGGISSSENIDEPSFAFSYRIQSKGRNISYRSEYRSKTDRIAPEDFPRYAEKLKKIGETISWEFWRDVPDPDTRETKEKIDPFKMSLSIFLTGAAVFLLNVLGLGADF